MLLKIVFSLATLILTPIAHANVQCLQWMISSGVTPGTKHCLTECASLITDMGTFACPSQCESLCSTILPPKYVEKYVYPGALTPAEQSLIAKYPLDAVEVYKAKQSAQKSTQRLFGRSRWNDEGDAFRHFMWAALIAKSIGAKKAKLFLDAHENRPNQSKSELNMDNFNNSQGINAATELKKLKQFNVEKLEKKGLKALREGKLKVIKPQGQVPKWIK